MSGFLLEGAITSIIGPLAARLINLIPDKQEAARETAALATTLAQADLEFAKIQSSTNQEEAKSAHWFVAAARPAVLWICALALFQFYVLFPSVISVCAVFQYIVILPAVDTTFLSAILTSLLGIGGMRSFDKFFNTDTKSFKQ